tara:strand:- start:270 stop:431 length:162 start_codon:yes stop_codon:yes gene_type:complete
MKATNTRVKGNYGEWYFVKENGYSLEKMDVIGQISIDVLIILGCFLGTLNNFG